MSETTKILMPDGGGCDASTMAAMMNNNNQWVNNPMMWLVWLAVLGRNGGLFGNNDNGQLQQIQDTMNSQATNSLILDSIKGNASAVADLANQLGCSTSQINSALCGINNNITSQGYQNQLANCQQTNAVEKNFAQTNYAMAEQACSIRQGAKDNTAAILAKLDSIEDSRKDREIASLTAANATLQARAERASELAPIVQQLNSIKCGMPQTVTLPYSCATAVPTALAYQSGLYGYPNATQWG